MFCKMVGIDCLINFPHHPWKTGIIISTVQIKRQSSERLMQRGLNHTARHTVVVVWILRQCLFPYTLLAPWNACCLNDLHREQHWCSGYDPCLLGNVPCFAECLASGLLSHCCLARNGSSAGLFRRTRTKDPLSVDLSLSLQACEPFRGSDHVVCILYLLNVLYTQESI